MVKINKCLIFLCVSLSFSNLSLLIVGGPSPVPVPVDFPGANHSTDGQAKPSWDQGLLQGALGLLAKLTASIKQLIRVTTTIISLIVIDQYLHHNAIAECCFQAKFMGQSKVT